MDAPHGHPAADLSPPSVDALAELRLGFVPLVRLLERLSPDAVRVGGEGPPAAEGIRFRHDRALQFHASDVVELTERDAEGGPRQYHVTSGFLGLSGAMSPLPAYFAEEVLHEDDEAPVRRDFLDLFHHRLLSLFYRTVVRYRLSSEHTTRLEDGWSLRALLRGRSRRPHPRPALGGRAPRPCSRARSPHPGRLGTGGRAPGTAGPLPRGSTGLGARELRTLDRGRRG